MSSSEHRRADGRAPADRLRASLRMEKGWRGWLRALPTGTRILACLAALGLVAAAIGALVLRSDAEAYPVLLLAGSLALLACFAAFSVRLFLWPLHRRQPRAASVAVWTAIALGIPILLALLPEAHGHVHEHPESFQGRGADFWPRAGLCLFFGFATSLPLLGLALLADRRDRLAVRRATLLAAGAGLAGNLTLLLHCPLVGRLHLLVGHAGLGFALVVLLGLVVRLRPGRPRARGAVDDM